MMSLPTDEYTAQVEVTLSSLAEMLRVPLSLDVSKKT